MARVFREGMEVPQDIDGGSATKKKKRKKAPPVKLPPLRPGQIDLPSDPDDGSVGLKKGGVANGVHRMPDGKMMKDSEHKGMMGGGKGYTPGGSTGKSPEMKNMPDTRPVPKDAKFGDRGASKRKSPEMKTMPNNRPPVEGSKFGDQGAPKRKSPYMVKLAGGGSVTRGDGIAKRGHTKGRLV